MQTKDRDIDFDINIAITVCRKSSSEDALILAEKHGLHLWYIKILLEDQRNYSAALQYIAKLEFTEVITITSKVQRFFSFSQFVLYFLGL